ncbi:MAG: CoA-binding protein [Hyphomicrobium sp.]|jgi:predicted CoA-binding protein|uniref:CoA-binding protein n=1 Tax=Hyphomicrobium sp. TaxID=82 RepID=UPI0025B7C2E9|nr:CoA-binding protein [Hyphomicrobium sp.]MBX9861996.1 CoA-binding protein [Hyphomicrobium sp.]
MTNPPDEDIAEILRTQRTFAMIGASNDPGRPSYGVMAYMQARGFRIIPINPAMDGQEILGERVYASLAALEGPIDVVDIFRRPDAVPAVVAAALAEKDRLAIKTIWMQIGVIHEEAAADARAAGLAVVMNRCPKIEYARLLA